MGLHMMCTCEQDREMKEERRKEKIEQKQAIRMHCLVASKLTYLLTYLALSVNVLRACIHCLLCDLQAFSPHQRSQAE